MIVVKRNGKRYEFTPEELGISVTYYGKRYIDVTPFFLNWREKERIMRYINRRIYEMEGGDPEHYKPKQPNYKKGNKK